VCELAPYPLTPAKLNLRTGPERMSFGGGGMTLATTGWESTQAETRDVMKYGLHEVKIKPATGVGPVTAFYVSTLLFSLCPCLLAILWGFGHGPCTRAMLRVMLQSLPAVCCHCTQP
jgi:hypothetical protein